MEFLPCALFGYMCIPLSLRHKRKASEGTWLPWCADHEIQACAVANQLWHTCGYADVVELLRAGIWQLNFFGKTLYIRCQSGIGAVDIVGELLGNNPSAISSVVATSGCPIDGGRGLTVAPAQTESGGSGWSRPMNAVRLVIVDVR